MGKGEKKKGSPAMSF